MCKSSWPVFCSRFVLENFLFLNQICRYVLVISYFLESKILCIVKSSSQYNDPLFITPESRFYFPSYRGNGVEHFRTDRLLALARLCAEGDE